MEGLRESWVEEREGGVEQEWRCEVDWTCQRKPKDNNELIDLTNEWIFAGPFPVRRFSIPVILSPSPSGLPGCSDGL